MNEQCLGQPRHSDQQTVAADEEREQYLLDDFFLPDDQLAELTDHLLPAVRQLIGERNIVGVVQLYGSDCLRQGFLPSDSGEARYVCGGYLGCSSS